MDKLTWIGCPITSCKLETNRTEGTVARSKYECERARKENDKCLAFHNVVQLHAKKIVPSLDDGMGSTCT